jgi:hypothetical protein
MQLIINTPVNNLSLGNVGFNLLRECYKRGYEIGWFPVGNTDLSAFKVDQPFVDWLQKSANQRYDFLGYNFPALVNWHIAGSERLFSNKQILLTYHETNECTSIEQNIVRNQYKTLFCGGFSEQVFRNARVDNVGSFDLGFDEEFHVTGKKYLEGRTVFNLIGKFEARKFTDKIIKLWIKKYGGNSKYSLNLLVENPFFSPEDNQKVLNAAFGGRKPFNVNVLSRLKTNFEMNELYNCCDVDLSGVGGESWGLPSFNATCLGKWSVVLNGAGQQAWANADNSVLVESSGIRECYDGVFFNKGAEFNQGSFPNVEDDALVAAFELAEKKVGTINQSGLDTGKKFTYSKTLDQILSHV